MSAAPPLAIAGDSSSRLLLALMLQRQGHEVKLFERAAAPHKEGQGLYLCMCIQVTDWRHYWISNMSVASIVVGAEWLLSADHGMSG